jgi:serine protease Do
MQNPTTKLTKRLAAGFLATSVAVTALALTPGTGTSIGNVLNFSSAMAAAVRVDAPKAPSFADVVQAVSPAVVSVRVEEMIQPASDNGEFRFDRRSPGQDQNLPEFFKNNPDLFKRFFGQQPGHEDNNRQKPERGMAQGSGFFITEDGYLVTNNHVVEGGIKYTVVMNDGTEFDAKLVGADERSDLAVLKVDDSRKFTYVSFSSVEPRIGDWVVAVGNPFGLGGTVTAGIVSARGREIGASRYDDFIQIDAAVNKGNSGGPAFDLNGEVIGVNTAIFSPSGGNVGIAFAIPASTSREIVDELISKGSIERGWLGVQIQPVSKDIAEALGLAEASGAMVTEPQDDSPAKLAGIQAGDVITKVDGTKIDGPKALARVIGKLAPSSQTSLTIFRGGKEMEVAVKLGKLDDNNAQSGTTVPEMKSGELGLTLGTTEDGEGALVTEVNPDSSAGDKGIQPGDVIASVNGEAVNSPDDAARLIGEAEKSGRKSTLLQIRRDGASNFVAVPFSRG